MIAAIRRRGVETVVDRSWFYDFGPWLQYLCLEGSERMGLPLRRAIGRNKPTCSQNFSCDRLRGETGEPGRLSEASLRLTLFGSALADGCGCPAQPPPPPPLPTSSAQRFAALLVLLHPSLKAPLLLSRPPSVSSKARSLPFPYIPLVVSSVQRFERNIHSTHHTT